MAEAALLVVSSGALAGGMVSSDVGDVERPSTDLRALSSQLGTSTALQSRPLGQSVGPARLSEATAHPSARVVGMVSRGKAAAAHSRP